VQLVLCSFCFSSRRRHTRSKRDWSSDVCSSDLPRKFCFLTMIRDLWLHIAIVAFDFIVVYLLNTMMEDEETTDSNGTLSVEEKQIGRASCRERVEVSATSVCLAEERKLTAWTTV